VPRRLRTGLTIFGYFTAAGLLFFGYRYLETVSNRERVSPLDPLINELFTGAWMAALLFPLVARFARRFPIHRSNWMTRVPLHVCALAVYSLAHTSLLWLLRPPLHRLFGVGSYDYGVMTARYVMEFCHDCIAYPVIVSILFLFDRQVRAAELEAKLSQARLENLRLQLQPHFLFNALNSISAAVYEDPRKADAMIARLSDLLRRTIADSGAQTAPLVREIETLELYLDVMRQRFEDKLRVDIQISPDVSQALTPHLLLQPLVENCIRENGSTMLRVRDHGRGIPKGAMKRGTGLSNTAERLLQLYGERHRLEFENCADGGLLVTVAFPFQT
jgi:signal transduction histidine kinase